MLPGELVTVGEVVRPWGRRGAVVVKPMTHDASRFDRLAEVWLRRADGRVEKRGLRLLRVAQDGRPLVEVEGVTTISEAEELRGVRLEVPKTEAERPDVEHYFNHDLVGCKVVGPDGVTLGRVEAIIDAPGANLLELDPGGALIPLVRSIVTRVDLAAKEIHVDPPSGLLELQSSTGQSSTGQSSTGQSSTGQSSTGQSSTGLLNTGDTRAV